MDQVIQGQKSHIDRISAKTKSLGEQVLQKDKEIKELNAQIEDLKIQAKIIDKLDQSELDIFQWADNIEKCGNLKDQITYLKNAFKTSASACSKLKKKITESERLSTLNENRNNLTIKTLKSKISELTQQLVTVKEENSNIKENIAKGIIEGTTAVIRKRPFSQLESDSKTQDKIDIRPPKRALMINPKRLSDQADESKENIDKNLIVSESEKGSSDKKPV